MDQTIIKELARKVLEAFALTQSIKIPPMSKSDFECFLREVKAGAAF
jgi:hypothetical protein